MNEKSLVNQIEYAIYDEQKVQLNLDYCKDINVNINYEIKDQHLLNKSMLTHFSDLGIDILDIKDSFYNDICYPYSNSVSDLVLKDRISDIYQNYSLCDNNCEYNGINLEKMFISCSCKVKKEINTDIKPPNFGIIVEDTFIYSNFGAIQCYNLVFSFKNKTKNLGFLFFLFLTIIHIPLYIYYFIYRLQTLKVFVYKEMEKNNYLTKINAPPLKLKGKIKSEKRVDLKFPSINYFSRNKKSSKTLKKKSSNDLNNSSCQVDYSSKSNSFMIKNIKHFNNHKIANKKKIKHKKKDSNKNNEKHIYNIENEKSPGYYHLIQINANNSTSNIPPESKYILDNYEYETALKYEKRTFCRILYICLLSKENILNTFFFKTNLEIQPIRLTIFLFGYSCDLALNALFYLNEKISNKYNYKGNYLLLFTIINNFTISISSTIFSFFLVKSLEYLTNSKDDIESLFRDEERKMRENKNFIVDLKTKKNIYMKLMKIFKILNIKIIIYIIVEFILMLFFFYYITSFCEVYKDTQISWIIDSFISFLLSLISELLTSFFTTVLYFVSLKYQLKFLYKIVIFFYGIG